MEKLLSLFWIFILGSVMGCIAEEIWCLIKNKCYQIRKSLVYSPMIPIYGFAATIIVIIADKVGYNLWKVFFIGMIVATIVEYVSSYVQEKVFHTISWDYSKMPFNLNGRVNLLYSLAFGGYAVLFIKQFTKIVSATQLNTNHILFEVVTLIVFILFMADVLITLLATIRQRRRREGIEASNNIERILDIRFNDERLDKIYNNSIYTGDV